ncbi:MAG: ABC transporter permease [Gemmatales bacterium]|nr:MAG: ABC transporter permease [Gemmatales bacterium]
MSLFRVLGSLLLFLLALPLAAPWLELAATPQGWLAWQEFGRIRSLAFNTLILSLGTLSIVLPSGTLLGFLLFRTDLPGARFYQLLAFVTLFVPLPLYTAAWQSAFGSDGLFFFDANTAWTPWVEGLSSAIGIHSLASLPWVILITGMGFLQVESELEEDALTAAGMWRVFVSTTLLRARGLILAAALFVWLQTTEEISAAYFLGVRSFAEEVYYQFQASDQTGLVRSVALSVPQVVLTFLILVAVGYLLRGWDSPLMSGRLSLVFRLGRWRWPLSVTLGCFSLVLAGVPLLSLLRKAGSIGFPPVFSLATATDYLHESVIANFGLILRSVLTALCTGVATGTLALSLCWLSLHARWLRSMLALVIAMGLALPAPILGFGLKSGIEWLIGIEEFLAHAAGIHPSGTLPLARILYFGPSFVPNCWAWAVRFFPYACLVCWPAVRKFPPELHDICVLDDIRPGKEFVHLVWPALTPFWLAASFLVFVLALSEIGASKLVATPGAYSYVQELFMRLHYGVTNESAALVLVLLAIVLLASGIAIGTAMIWRRRNPIGRLSQ